MILWSAGGSGLGRPYWQIAVISQGPSLLKESQDFKALVMYSMEKGLCFRRSSPLMGSPATVPIARRSAQSSAWGEGRERWKEEWENSDTLVLKNSPLHLKHCMLFNIHTRKAPQPCDKGIDR